MNWLLQTALPLVLSIASILLVAVTFALWCRERMQGKPPWVVEKLQAAARIFARPKK